MTDRDRAEMLKWVDLSGMECVARVAAALTRDGQRGQTTRPDTLLLIEMARRAREKPERTTNDLADEIAREAVGWRWPRINESSLKTELARGFRKHRTKWFLLARSVGDRFARWSPAMGVHSPTFLESRALGRIIEMLPEAIDLFDAFLGEAERLQPERVPLIKRVGRERLTALLADAVRLQMKAPQGGNRSIPRNFLDLIKPELDEMEEQFKRRPAKRGRKPPN